MINIVAPWYLVISIISSDLITVIPMENKAACITASELYLKSIDSYFVRRIRTVCIPGNLKSIPLEE